MWEILFEGRRPVLDDGDARVHIGIIHQFRHQKPLAVGGDVESRRPAEGLPVVEFRA